MAIGDIVVSLDLGASKVASLVGQVNKFNEIEVIGYGLSKNDNIIKGKIINPKETASSIRQSIEAAEEISGLSINSVYVNAKGINTKILKKIIEIDVEKPDDGISVNDINNIFYNLQLITTLEKDEQIIDILPIEYRVNSKSYKQEPLGTFSKRLEIYANVVVVKADYLEGLLKCLKLANLKLDGIILETLATSNIVLMPEEKELGVLMIDIGAGHTDISVYKDNELQFYDTLPVGGNHITSDLALTFNVSSESSDKLKRQYNLAIQAMIKNDREVKITTLEDTVETVKCSDIVMVIEARVKEIFQIIRKIISENNLISKIECMVLTGQGVTSIIGVEELSMLMLKINQVRICMPKLVTVIKPEHTTVFGMVRYISSLGYSKHINSDVEIIRDPVFKDKIIDIIEITKSKILKTFKGKDKKENKDKESLI